MTLSAQARERGMWLTSFNSHLEVLDRAGALRPIAFHLSPYFSGPFSPSNSNMRFREDSAFRAWRHYRWSEREPTTVTPLYSPWQLLYLNDVIRGNALALPLDAFMSDALALRHIKLHRSFARSRRKAWRGLDDAWLPTIKLLTRIQNRYLPFVTRVTQETYNDRGKRMSPLPQEVAEFDAARVAHNLGVSGSKVAALYYFLAAAAERHDDVEHLYVVLRAARRRDRDRLRGGTRLAHDYYNACSMLRLFNEDLTGDVLPEPNEIGHPSGLNEELLGRPIGRGYALSDMRTAIKRSAFSPDTVRLFVEGATEAELFRLLLDYGGIATEVEVHDLAGGGNAKTNKDLLTALAERSRATLLVADNEGLMKAYAQEWIASGAVHEDNVFVWSSLEEENFAYSELLAVVRRAGKLHAPDVRLRLTVRELRSSYEAHRSLAQKPRGLLEHLLKLAARDDIGPIRCSKSKDCAAEMFRIIQRDVQRLGWDEVAKKRPIAGVVIRLGQYVG